MSEKDSSKKVEQPVAAPVATAPQPTVQYIVQEKSLSGVGGWLIFWLIVLGIYAVYGVIFTFVWIAALAEGSADPSLIVATIFTPLIAASFITTIVLISMQKKLGKIMAWVSFGIVALFATVFSIVLMFREYCTSAWDSGYYYSYSAPQTCEHMPIGGIIMMIGIILMAWVAAGLVSLYFLKSKRVALTLTK